MANTYYDSDLTGEQIEQALEAIDGVIVSANNGKVLAVDNGKIVARSVQRSGGGGDVSSVNNILPDLNGNVTVTADDIQTDDNTSVQDEIDSAKNTLSHKADVIYDTASGPIASFPDGADGLPVKDLTVGIEPVQDLHGYEYPWPAGGGANKFDGEIESGDINIGDGETRSSSTRERSKNFIPVVPGEQYRAVSSAYTNFIVCLYGENKEYVGDYQTYINVATTNPFTIPSNCYYIKFYRNTQTDKNVAINYPSTVTAYSPYSNICPISGWTGANVVVAGRNVYDPTKYALDNPSANDSIALNGDTYTMTWADGRGIFKTNGIQSFPAGTYTLNAFVVGNGSLSNLRIYAREKDNTSNVIAAFSGVSVSFTANKEFVISGQGYYATPGTMSFKIQLEPGTSANPYEQFKGITILPISWQSSAGTVYGGTLDVTTGVLTVTDANIASYNGETLPGEWISDRDVYSAGATPTTGAQVVYKLATPQTYQLTPTEVTTLLGQNNIWADCGPSTVEYPADTKLYIDKKLAALVAALS